MTDAVTSNPFAPPRAHVQDPFRAPQAMVEATRLSRLLATLVDAAPGIVVGVVGIVGVLAAMPEALSGRFDPSHMPWGAIGGLVVLLVLLCVGWVIWQISLLYRYGQTVGKKVLGIRVVRMDGSRVSFPRFFFLRGGVLWGVRMLVGGIAGGLSAAAHFRYGNFSGYIVTLVDSLMIFGASRRCLHDLIADTRVVTADSSPDATLEGSKRP